jgi:hypothetical protein
MVTGAGRRGDRRCVNVRRRVVVAARTDYGAALCLPQRSPHTHSLPLTAERDGGIPAGRTAPVPMTSVSRFWDG